MKGIKVNMNSILDCESKSLERINSFQLPIIYKKIGIGLFLISITALFVIAFTSSDDTFKLVAKYGMLIGLLIVSISKEKIEDELVRDLRLRSFSFAFIVGVLYALSLPFIDFFIDLIAQSESAAFEGLGDFQILWILLACKVSYFELLKRTHK